MASLFHLFHSLLPPVRVHQISQPLLCCGACRTCEVLLSSFPGSCPSCPGAPGGRADQSREWPELWAPANSKHHPEVASQRAGVPCERGAHRPSSLTVTPWVFASQACRRVRQKERALATGREAPQSPPCYLSASHYPPKPL